MNKIESDPLLSIFKNTANKDEYIEEIENIKNISNFFDFISSPQVPDDSKIGVLENFLEIIKNNRYICEYFSSNNNRSLYLYLFDIYISKNSSEKLKSIIINLLRELILSLETNKEVYEYIFQSLSKIYNIEDTTQEKTPQNLYNHFELLDTLLSYNEKIPKPRNYFTMSGNGKFSLCVKEKGLNIGYCMTFAINFKINVPQKSKNISNLIKIKFSNNTSISLYLKDSCFLCIKHGNEKEKLLKGLPPNEFVILVLNLIVEGNILIAYSFVNGENNLTPIKYKNDLNTKKDTIESLEFFENFYGEVTSMTMLNHKEKGNITINSKKFLPSFKDFTIGFSKKKYLKQFLNLISDNCSLVDEEKNELKDKIQSGPKLIEDLVFVFTPFNYFHLSWIKNKNHEENTILNDYFNKYNLLIIDKDRSIRNHRYQYYQKKLYLVCDISNLLPIAELFLIHPQLLTEENLEKYLKIVESIINFRKRNIEDVKNNSFFTILGIFIEKYPNQIFTEKILNAFINIGKDMFKINVDELTNEYFENILLNEKILSKYSINLQIKFWNHLLLFCQSDKDQLETFLKMNTLCLILRSYENNCSEICCENHFNMIKEEFRANSKIMEPSMEEKLKSIRDIIDLIINSQRPNWILSLFKLLMLDLSSCLSKFIITSVTKALLVHEEGNKIKEKKDQAIIKTFNSMKSMLLFTQGSTWLKDFVQMILINYETILINTFIHSLPDVRLDILKLFYQMYQILISLEKVNEFKNIFNMMKNNLLPQKIFYEKFEDKEIIVINDSIMKQYLNEVVELLINWALNEKLVLKDNEICFQENSGRNLIIKNCDILEIIFELLEQANYDIEITLKFLEVLLESSKIEINCDVLLYNYKIFLMIINLVYNCFILKLNNTEKNTNIENSFSLGKKLISNIYINDLIYNENKYFSENYPLNEISLIFIWGDKKLFKINNSKNANIDNNNIFSFINILLMEILNDFKLKIYPKIKMEYSDDIKQHFIKSYYEQNYLILISKLFQFSFEFTLDSVIKNNQIMNALPSRNIASYYYLFITSMRFDNSKGRTISLFWNDYQFFEEIYSKISYLWSKDYIYKGYEKGKLKNSNKIKKYEDILDNYILCKDKRNIFKSELELLCTYYAKENKYEISKENEENNNNEKINTSNYNLNITFMKQIQIVMTTMLNLIDGKKNDKNEILKWIKEFKHFTIFIIIASSNIILREKDGKENNESNISSYMNLQEQSLFCIYNCLYFLTQLRSSLIFKEKIDKICINVFSLTFIILRYAIKYRKKHKISKKFSVGYKYHIDDLSGSAIFTLFNDYIKDLSKKKDEVLMSLDKLDLLLDENNYSHNIIKLLDEKNWKDSFYEKNDSINAILDEKYFPINEYISIAQQRIDFINKLEILNSKEEWKYSSDEILKLLPSYEKELVFYSNNSLEKTLKKKNMYKVIKKEAFSWRGYWSNKSIFYQEKNRIINRDNDSIIDKNNVSKIKYKLVNHYTKSLMKPLLVPILDINYYLPDFTGFDSSKIFNTKNQFIVNMEIGQIKKIKEEQKAQDEEKTNLKENYLRKIYKKSNPALAEKLLKISETLDFGKEEEFSVFNEEKDTKTQEENKDDAQKEMEKEEKNYYLCCLVKTSHHIKGVCFIDDSNLNFKVFLNQKTGKSMSGVNIGFTDKDDDYDKERKTCFGSYFMFHQKDKNLYKISINYDNIKLILLRRYYYKNSALEIFTTTNKSYYLNFKYEEDRESFINKIIRKFSEPKAIINDLKESKTTNLLGYSVKSQLFKSKRKYTRKELEKEEKNNVFKLSKIVKEWSKWKINNFSFLMWMNFYANRSYNDISQYPVFPWILSNYDEPLKIEQSFFQSSLYYDLSNRLHSSSHSLNDTSRTESETTNDSEAEKKKKKKKGEEEYNYRDMKLPMGMMEINGESKKRKKDYIDLYNNIKHNQDEFEGIKPHFYGTNYSNPIYVCNYLIRLFPFTHISIELQGNNIDDPNRLFLSVIKSFNNSITHKADVRELIPEFFYLPEMFLNINDINLGKLEDNSVVYNVQTPCENNAYSFVDIMKRIFENNKISNSLNNWVDLIFGYKSRGKDAENAKNIFTESSYQESINLKNIEDKTSYLRGVEFGLIPTQIMNKECQKREKKTDIRKEKELTEYNMNNVSKIKIVKIKQNDSNDKNVKNKDGTKAKLLKVNFINNDKIMLLYENNTIIDDKINSSNEDINTIYKIESFENQINFNCFEKINNKVFKFCNSGKTFVVGGFYDGRIEIIHLEEKYDKTRKEIYPFSEEEPILSINIDTEETFMILGNCIGNIAIYQIDIEKDIWKLYKKIFNQMNSISDININNDLNLFSTSSIDGFINLYTLPTCKLIRAIKCPIDSKNSGKCNYIFLSESSLPSLTIITEDINNCEIFSYSINGTFLNSLKEDKSLDSPLKIKDLNSIEYLVYYSNSSVSIRNLPSLSLQIIIKDIFNVKFLFVNEDLSTIYSINEDGTQMQAIKK